MSLFMCHITLELKVCELDYMIKICIVFPQHRDMEQIMHLRKNRCEGKGKPICHITNVLLNLERADILRAELASNTEMDNSFIGNYP